MCKTRTMRREGSALAGSELTLGCPGLDAIVVNCCLGRVGKIQRVVLENPNLLGTYAAKTLLAIQSRIQAQV